MEKHNNYFLTCIVGIATCSGIWACSQNYSELNNRNSCKADSECSENESCEYFSGKCLIRSGEISTLEIWPPLPNSGGLVPQEFTNIVLPSQKTPYSFYLEQGFSIEGVVKSSDDDSVIIPARITAWRDSSIPGRPRVEFQTLFQTQSAQSSRINGGSDSSSSQNSVDDITNASFVLWLNKDANYSFFVVPVEPYDVEYPPLFETGIMLTQPISKDFILEGKKRAVDVHGFILQYDGTPLPNNILSDEQQTPLNASVKIRATEIDGTRMSTTGKSDSLSGSFSFRLPAGIGTYQIAIDSLPGSIPIPNLTCQGIVLGLVSTLGVQDIGELRMPLFLWPRYYNARVVGNDGTPVKGASVSFQTALEVDSIPPAFSSCSATYSQTAVSDAEGKISIPLIPEGANQVPQHYKVVIASPADSKFSSKIIESFPLTLTAIENRQQGAGKNDFVLDSRIEIKGCVYDSHMRPVKNTSIEAEGVPVYIQSKMLPLMTTSTISDENGNFNMFIDPGDYIFKLTPPEGLGLPQFSLPKDLIDTTGTYEINFNFPEAELFTGIVSTPDNSPYQGARIEYLSIDKTTNTVLKTSTVSRNDGKFYLLLPQDD